MWFVLEFCRERQPRHWKVTKTSWMCGACNELCFFCLASLLFPATSRETSWTIEREPEFSSLDFVTSAGFVSQQCLYPKLYNQGELYEPMSLRFFDSLNQCYLWNPYCVPVAALVTEHWRFKDKSAHFFQPKSLESMSNADNPSSNPHPQP